MNNTLEEKEVLKIVKHVVQEELEKHGFKVIDIILFGSRARGDAQPDSDWDFFVVIDKTISLNKKREILRNIRRYLAQNGIPNDILIQPQKLVEERKDDFGCITYFALREGINVSDG